MQLINDRYDNMIEKKMRKHAMKNKNALDAELIQKIKYTDTYTNSISVAVGRQRSGKTRKILKEIIKIANLHTCTHMLVYINKTGQKTDKTFESMKGLIKLPIVYCSQNDCEDTLVGILEAKQQYNSIKKQGIENDIDPTYTDEIFEKLGINDFSRPYLHTLVLLDDIANSSMLTKSTSTMNNLMTQCAHINCSFFLAVQFWKGLPASLKSQATTIYLFGGFSKEQVRYILRQITLQNPFDVVFDEYKALDFQDYMYIDIVESQYTIVTRRKETKEDMQDVSDDDSEEEEEEEEINEDIPLKQPEPEEDEPEQIPQQPYYEPPQQIYQQQQAQPQIQYYYYYV